MSHAFRELLRKIGSGTHTGKDLTRQEAAAATRMMLLQEATPAQIGAFMISHRIKRPTGEELAGMLDAYDELGPKLQPISTSKPVTILGAPYDGRDRTAPISPLTALILTAANCPVVMHGGGVMPTKEGVPLVEFWQGLGVDWTRTPLLQMQQIFEKTDLGFVYLPSHFPLAQSLVPYREQIGKRPPFATLELIWAPYAGTAHTVVGFVHPPTEAMAREAFALRGAPHFTTVKGLEGSSDLPRERTAIVGLGQPGLGQLEGDRRGSSESDAGFERLHLHPRDYGFAAANVPLRSTDEVVKAMQATLEGEPSELTRSAVWNGGFYLWRCGVCADMTEAIATAEIILTQGQALQKLRDLQAAIAPVHLIPQA